MITAIEVTNWKTHKNTKIDFQKGVNVLIGVMGAGKSSIMDAISFGLFGTFPALSSKRVSLANLISNRPKLADHAEVKLSFGVDKDEYTVTRRIGEKGSEAKLEKNGKYVQTQATKVTEEIENLLKIDYDTFARAIYSEQNQLDYFLELRKSERKVQIDHMLGLDQFATAEENTTSLVNSVKSIITYEEEALGRTDIKEVEKQLNDLEKEKEKNEKEQQQLKQKEKEMKSEIESAKKKIDQLREQSAKKKALSDEIVKLNSRINTLNQEIKKINELKIDQKAVEKSEEKAKQEKELSKQIDEGRKKEKMLIKEIAELESSIKEGEKKLSEKTKLEKELKGESLDEVTKRIEHENKLLKEIIDQLAQKKSKKGELEEWKNELSKHISKCPVCEREIAPELRKKLYDDKVSLLEGIENEIKKNEKSSTEKNTEIKALNEVHNKLLLASSKLKDYANIDTLLASATKKKNEKAGESKEVTQNLEKINKEHEGMREEIAKLASDIESVKRRKTLEQEIKSDSEEIEEKNKKFKDTDVDEKAIEKLQDEYTKQNSLLSSVSTNILNGKKYLDGVETQIKDKEKQIKSYREVEKKISAKRNQLNNLNKFKAALVDTETLLRNRLVGSINGLMQGLWPEIYPYSDYSSLRLDARKDDYQLEVNATGTGSENWISVDSVASGGERSTACLTMRIALSMVIVPNLKWLILDEPTHNIDSTGIAKMIDVLGNALPKVVEQIFIITHDEDLKQINAARVYLLDRDKAKNESTVASEI